jgi:MFS family permease
MLADDKGLSTLPFALMFAGVMTATVPASLLMRHFGRRLGFTFGQLIGIAAASLSTYAIFAESFWLFAVGGFMFGLNGAFGQQLRFAAADTASSEFRSRAISLVMAGGVVGAFAGPELAKATRDLFEPVVFAGCFATIAVVMLINISILQFIRIPRMSAAERRDTGRPLTTILQQPATIVAILASMIGYGSMSLVMTATPLAVIQHEHSFADAAFVIQWHVVGMFAPSFVTGHLIHRFGAVRIVLTGALLVLGCAAINLTGIEIAQFWAALVLLGVGWNFMFIGGTSLLATTYQPKERAKIQGFNDFLVFGTVAAASFSSGALHHALGWQVINLGIILPVTVAAGAALWLLLQRSPVPAE